MNVYDTCGIVQGKLTRSVLFMLLSQNDVHSMYVCVYAYTASLYIPYYMDSTHDAKLMCVCVCYTVSIYAHAENHSTKCEWAWFNGGFFRSPFSTSFFFVLRFRLVHRSLIKCIFGKRNLHAYVCHHEKNVSIKLNTIEAVVVVVVVCTNIMEFVICSVFWTNQLEGVNMYLFSAFWCAKFACED